MFTDKTDGQTDGRQTVTLRFPLDAASTKIIMEAISDEKMDEMRSICLPSRAAGRGLPASGRDCRRPSRRSVRRTRPACGAARRSRSPRRPATPARSPAAAAGRAAGPAADKPVRIPSAHLQLASNDFYRGRGEARIYWDPDGGLSPIPALSLTVATFVKHLDILRLGAWTSALAHLRTIYFALYKCARYKYTRPRLENVTKVVGTTSREGFFLLK